MKRQNLLRAILYSSNPLDVKELHGQETGACMHVDVFCPSTAWSRQNYNKLFCAKNDKMEQESWRIRIWKHNGIHACVCVCVCVSICLQLISSLFLSKISITQAAGNFIILEWEITFVSTTLEWGRVFFVCIVLRPFERRLVSLEHTGNKPPETFPRIGYLRFSGLSRTHNFQASCGTFHVGQVEQ